MNRINYALWLILFFLFSACADENGLDKNKEIRDISKLSIGELTMEEMMTIDEEKYNTYMEDDIFKNIAEQYKKWKDKIYNENDVDYEEVNKSLDSIRVNIAVYAKEHSCPNMVIYIDKYANSILNVSRCVGGEPIDNCWKRVWDYYETTYNEVYAKVKDKGAVIQDLYLYIKQHSSQADIVFRDMITYNHSWSQIEFMGGLKSYFRSLGFYIYEDSEVHNINKSLGDCFYGYYISGRWKEVGGFGGDNVCSICKFDPCICYTPCPVCHHLKIECICCPTCHRYPCVCNNPITPPYPRQLQHNHYIDDIWQQMNLESQIEIYVHNYFGDVSNVGFCQLLLPGSKLVKKVFHAQKRGDEMVPIPVPVDAGDYGFIHLHGYSAYPDGIDIFNYTKALQKFTDKRRQGGIQGFHLYTMFYITFAPFTVYAITSTGELGDYFKYMPELS